MMNQSEEVSSIKFLVQWLSKNWELILIIGLPVIISIILFYIYKRQKNISKGKNKIDSISLFCWIVIGICVAVLLSIISQADLDKLLIPLTTLMIAIPGAYIAYMRQKHLEYQNDNDTNRLDKEDTRLENDRKKLNNEVIAAYNKRYLEATELLSNQDNPISRLAAVNSLSSLADDWDSLIKSNPNDPIQSAEFQRKQCMQLLVDYLSIPMYLEEYRYLVKIEKETKEKTEDESRKEIEVDTKVKTEANIRLKILQSLNDRRDYIRHLMFSEEKQESIKNIIKEQEDKKQQEQKITQDINKNKLNLSFLKLTRVYLIKVNLSGANLIGANLSKANLSKANLIEADLFEADLIGANLIGADLRGANLIGADLRYANLSKADLRYANLSKADLRYANLSKADLLEADLIGADLFVADLIGANLSGANLSEANLFGAYLRGANLFGANLSEANLSEACYDENTSFDCDFDCKAHGMKFN